MSWFARNGRTLRIVCGVAAGTGVVAFAVNSDKFTFTLFKKEPEYTLSGSVKREPFLSSKLPVNKVLASYTTNTEPSVKWDSNWDR